MLGDDTTKVFLNTKGKLNDVDQEMKEFLAYIENSTDEFVQHTQSELIKTIHAKVSKVKTDKTMEVEYITLLERDREKIQEGIEQGIEQTAEVFKLVMKGYKSKEIAEKLNMCEDKVEAIVLKIKE